MDLIIDRAEEAFANHILPYYYDNRIIPEIKMLSSDPCLRFIDVYNITKTIQLDHPATPAVVLLTRLEPSMYGHPMLRMEHITRYLERLVNLDGSRSNTLYYLSKNPNIPVTYINEHAKKQWFMSDISKRLPLSDIEENPQIKWMWGCIATREDIDVKFIIRHYDKLCIYSRYYSKSHKLKISDLYSEILWSWYEISSNPVFTMNDVKDNPMLPWNYLGLSKNPSLRMSFVLEAPEKFCFEEVSRNSGIQIKEILRHKNLPWIGRDVALNPNFTIDHVQFTFYSEGEKMIIPWDYLFKNPAIPYRHFAGINDLGLKKYLDLWPNVVVKSLIDIKLKFIRGFYIDQTVDCQFNTLQI